MNDPSPQPRAPVAHVEVRQEDPSLPWRMASAERRLENLEDGHEKMSETLARLGATLEAAVGEVKSLRGAVYGLIFAVVGSGVGAIVTVLLTQH